MGKNETQKVALG